ncbi:MAG: hypothetical protein C0602_13220 [Denitrovibrio sp.]|nr:MAG: hypothetical protein C0602_13220 [Denitrovibrio sp.]
MNITHEEGDKLTITGEMKTIENYTAIKNALNEVIQQGSESVTIEIKDSLTITSSIIGLFTKTVHGDGLKINLLIHSERLYNLLEDLNLIVVFNVKKAK